MDQLLRARADAIVPASIQAVFVVKPANLSHHTIRKILWHKELL